MTGVEQRAREYTAKIFNGATPSEVVKAYIVGATDETRELKRELEEERFVTEDLKKQIEKMKCCYNCKHSRTDYEHCITNKHEKWEMIEK